MTHFTQPVVSGWNGPRMYASQATWEEGYRTALADLIARTGLAPNSTKGGAKGSRDDWQVGHSLWHRDLLLFGRAGCRSNADACSSAPCLSRRSLLQQAPLQLRARLRVATMLRVLGRLWGRRTTAIRLGQAPPQCKNLSSLFVFHIGLIGYVTHMV